MEQKQFSRKTAPAKIEYVQPIRDVALESRLKQKFGKLSDEYKNAQDELKQMNVVGVLNSPTHEHEKVLAVFRKLGEITTLASTLDETLMEMGAAPDSPIRSTLGRELTHYRELMQKFHDTHEFNRTASALKLGKIEAEFNQRGNEMNKVEHFFPKGGALEALDAEASVGTNFIEAGTLQAPEQRADTVEDYEKQLAAVDDQLKESRTTMDIFVETGKVKEKNNGLLTAAGLFGFLNRELAKKIATHNALLVKQQQLTELVIPRASMAQNRMKKLVRNRAELSPITVTGKREQSPITATRADETTKEADELNKETDEFKAIYAAAKRGEGVSVESLRALKTETAREEHALTLEDYEEQLAAIHNEIADMDKTLANYGSAVGRNKDGTIYQKLFSRQPSKEEVMKYNNLIKKEIDLTDKVIPRTSEAQGRIKSLRRRSAGLSATTVESGENARHKSSETAEEHYLKPFTEAKQKQAEIPKFETVSSPVMADREARRQQRETLAKPVVANPEILTARQFEDEGDALLFIANKIDEGMIGSAGQLEEALHRAGLMNEKNETDIYENGKPMMWKDVVRAISKGFPGFKKVNKELAIKFFEERGAKTLAEAAKTSAASQEKMAVPRPLTPGEKLAESSRRREARKPGMLDQLNRKY